MLLFELPFKLIGECPNALFIFSHEKKEKHPCHFLPRHLKFNLLTLIRHERTGGFGFLVSFGTVLGAQKSDQTLIGLSAMSADVLDGKIC